MVPEEYAYKEGEGHLLYQDYDADYNGDKYYEDIRMLPVEASEYDYEYHYNYDDVEEDEDFNSEDNDADNTMISCIKPEEGEVEFWADFYDNGQKTELSTETDVDETQIKEVDDSTISKSPSTTANPDVPSPTPAGIDQSTSAEQELPLVVENSESSSEIPPTEPHDVEIEEEELTSAKSTSRIIDSVDNQVTLTKIEVPAVILDSEVSADGITTERSENANSPTPQTSSEDAEPDNVSEIGQGGSDVTTTTSGSPANNLKLYGIALSLAVAGFLF